MGTYTKPSLWESTKMRHKNESPNTNSKKHRASRARKTRLDYAISVSLEEEEVYDTIREAQAYCRSSDRGPEEWLNSLQ